MSEKFLEYSRDPVAFIDELVKVNELGQPFHLFDYQREILRLAFAFDDAGLLPWTTIVWSAIKKSGKSFIQALLAIWWAYTQEAPNEIPLTANDLEQVQGRVFKSAVEIIKHNPILAASAEITSRQITLSSGTTITAFASEYAGAAGGNHGFTGWDELWAYVNETSLRLWDELGPVPTRRNSIRLVTTYAGFEGESALLWDLYKRGVSRDEYAEGLGERLHPTLPVYGNRESRLFVYWDHEPRLPWQTPAYLAARRQDTRPPTYLRHWQNRWTTGESRFIEPELWDSCVDRDLSPALIGEAALFVGVDAGIKNDNAARVAVRWDGDKLALVSHRIWRPSQSNPLNIELTIEMDLRELAQRHHLAAIYCDPYQLHRSITTLQAAGLPIREFPQTTSGTTRMGQALFELLQGRNIRLYPGDDLRAQALNTVAVETSRGWRIAKEKAAKKIDAITALSMACVAALDGKPNMAPLTVWGGGIPDDPDRAEELEKTRYAESVRVVADAIKQKKVYWPGED